MRKQTNIWAVILSAIVVLGLLVGFFFLGYFSSAKGWIEIKEPAPAEEELPEGETGGEDETGGEEVALKAAAYTVSLKGDVETLAVIGGGDIQPVKPCPECGNTLNVTKVEARCEVDGFYREYCSQCLYKYEETYPATGHDWGSGILAPASERYCADTKYTCSNCNFSYYALSGTSARTSHQDEITASKESTCIEAGFRVHNCAECGYGWQEALPLANHTLTSSVTQYPTCTVDGVRSYSCTVCGAVDHTEAIPATGHTYPEAGEGIVTKAATCTEPGIMSYTCTVCGQGAYTEPIQALGHKFELVEATAPNCTEPGHGQYMQCTRCEAVSGEIMEIPATGHKWTEWEETRESCDVAGERTRTCTVCDEVESEELEAGAHSWDDGVISKAPTCTESGVRTKTCELCGDTMTETVDAVGHKPAKMAAVAATCTKTGLSEGERCTACGITLTAQQVIPALGHKMQYHAAVAATETVGGNIEYWQCNTCGVCYTDAEGKTQISAEDTLTPPLGAEEPGDEPGDEEPAEDKEGLEWWAWALIVAGAVIVIGLALVIVDQVAAKNKAKSNGGSKPTQGNGNNYGNNGGSRNNYNNYNGSRNHKNKGKKR